MRTSLITAALILSVAGAAIAAPTTTTAPAKPATAAMTAAPAKTASTATAATPAKKGARTPISIACSKQADAKGLHGKDRKKFRDDCMKKG